MGYIILFLVTGILGFSNLPPMYNLLIGLYIWSLSFFLSVYFFHKSIYNTTIGIFIYQCLSILLITAINIEFYNEPYGYNPIDALSYRYYGEAYGGKDFFSYVVAFFFTNDLDDFGYSTLVWFCYHLFDKFGAWIILILNAFVIAVSSKRLYEISILYIDRGYSKLVMMIWGFSAFATTTACEGLKENFMVFTIISFFYYLSRFQIKKTLFGIFPILLYIGLVFCFRLATGYAALLCFLIYIFLNCTKVKNNIRVITWLGLAIAIVAFPSVMQVLIQQRGLGEDTFSSQSAEQAESIGGMIGYIINVVSSLIGPFPCFISSDSEKLNYLTRYSLTPFFKMILSYFFYYGLLEIYKKKVVQMYPMAIFVLINILMIIIAFFGLHVRYQWIHMPLFIMISIWGYNQYCLKQGNTMLFFVYGFMCIILIMFYNIR